MAKPTGPICNLDCGYCFYLEKEHSLPGRERRWLMDDATLEQFVRSYIEAQPTDMVTFAWQGGEPTLCGLPFFQKAVAFQKKYANGRTIENSFQTNGTTLNEDWAKFFADNKFLIGVSIDGPADLHDKYRLDKRQRPTHAKVVEGIEALQRAGAEYNTLTCVHKGNQSKPEKVYRFLKGLGSKYLQFIPIVERKADTCASKRGLTNSLPPQAEEADPDSPVMPWSVGSREFGDFLLGVFRDWVRKDVGKIYVQAFDMALGKWVGAPGGICVHEPTCGKAMALESDGGVYACDHYVYPEFHIGNLNEQPLSELAASPRMKAFGDAKRDSLPRYCRECPVRFACNGGCPKHRFIDTPDGEPGLNYLCAGYRKFFTGIAEPMRIMTELYRQQRPPAEIMQLVAAKRVPGFK